MDTFTSSQVAKTSNISLSALRRYIKLFGHHYSKSATRARGRRYTQQDVATTLKIRDMFRSGYNEQEINKQLGIVGNEEIDASELVELIPAIAKPVTEALDNTRANKASIEVNKNNIDQINERLEQAEQERKKEQEQNDKRARTRFIILLVVGIAILVWLTILTIQL